MNIMEILLKKQHEAMYKHPDTRGAVMPEVLASHQSRQRQTHIDSQPTDGANVTLTNDGLIRCGGRRESNRTNSMSEINVDLDI